MVVARCEQVKWQPVDSLDATDRAEGVLAILVVRVFPNSFCYVIQIHCFSIVVYVVLARLAVEDIFVTDTIRTSF